MQPISRQDAHFSSASMDETLDRRGWTWSFAGFLGGFVAADCCLELRLLVDEDAGDRLSVGGCVMRTSEASAVRTRSKRQRTTANTTPAAANMPQSQEPVCVVCAVVEGSAVCTPPLPAQASADEAQERTTTFDCDFCLRDLSGTWKPMHCRATFSGSAASISVIWDIPTPLKADPSLHGNREAFTLARVVESASVSESCAETQGPASPLSPLTAGTYEFQGFSVVDLPTNTHRRRRRARQQQQEDEARRDYCFVTLQLLPSGKIRGFSRELLHPQTCPLYGSWKPDRLSYVIEYHVRDAVGKFRYLMKAHPETRDLLAGTFHNVDGDHAEGYSGGRGTVELTLSRVAPLAHDAAGNIVGPLGLVPSEEASEPVEDRTRALTTGDYTFKGCATDDDGYEYASELQLSLLPHGLVQGSGREHIFAQTHEIRGGWTRATLTYYQGYVVKGEVGTYVYVGTLSTDGAIINGRWQNVAMPPEDTKSYAQLSGERGSFALAMVKSLRRWSVSSHVDFPVVFRRAVLHVLLCSQRRSCLLPTAVWLQVFSFCAEDWFASLSSSRAT